MTNPNFYPVTRADSHVIPDCEMDLFVSLLGIYAHSHKGGHQVPDFVRDQALKLLRPYEASND